MKFLKKIFFVPFLVDRGSFGGCRRPPDSRAQIAAGEGRVHTSIGVTWAAGPTANPAATERS